MDTKWWPKHVGLLSKITGRDLAWETRPRLSVVHVTYVDPDYLVSGRRRHDAWTTGDQHDLPYRPRTVLVVENRDCRLWFPEMPETVVVEGEGKAAAALLDGIDWVLDAERLVYWGDIDADGFAILNHLRGVLRERGADVESLLMDEAARRRYAHLGVSRDRAGQPLQPSGVRLGALDRDEANCYTNIATRGPAEFRRIEQERIPLQDAAAELEGLLRRDR